LKWVVTKYAVGFLLLLACILALTGLLTPPGISLFATSKSLLEASELMKYAPDGWTL